MKKKVVRLSLLISAIVMVFALCACGDKEVKQNNNINHAEVQEFSFEENANNFKINAESPKTDILNKQIKISPYQSGTITIRKNISSGDLKVDIINRDSYGSIGTVTESNNEEIYNIKEGAGTYQVLIDMDGFIGSCEISWETADVYKEEEFTSAFGYKVKYIPEKFSYRNENGKETFTLKSDDETKSKLYFSAYLVDASDKDNEKNKLKEGAEVTSNCTFDNEKLQGEYAKFPQEDNMEITRFMIDINDGKMIVVETLQYAELYEKSSANAFIKGLLSSFSYEK